MSTTQELIAAALTAADELDFIHEHAPIEHTTNDLREACARAMVQPPAPDMAEVERLIREFEYAAGPYGHDLRCIASRTALLDYVRGVLAERDALMLEFCPQEMTEVQKEKWARNQQPVGEPAENSYEWFQREIQRLQKHVAVTWPDWMQRTSGLSTATFPTVGAAEVPMPDIAGELFDGKRVCDDAALRGEVKP